MVWSYWFVNTITGEKQLQVEPAGGSFGRVLNAAGSGSHVFKLGDRRLPRQRWWELTEPWARTLVQCWDDVPVYAGLITGRPYSRDSQTLTVTHTDIRSLFLDRYPFGVASYWADELNRVPGKLTITNKSIVAALAKVLEQGMLGPVGAADYTLPVVLPSTGTAGSFSRTFENFNFQNVADIMAELQEMDGGPDVEFAPRWSSSGRLEWVLRAGALTGGTFEWHLEAEQSPVSSFTVAEDALKQVTGTFGVGQGSGADMIVGGTPGVATAAIPARDVIVKWQNVPTDAEASSLAKEHVAAHRDPTVQPALKVLASTVDPTTLILGSTIRTYDLDDPWLPDGWTDQRLIGVSGGVGEEIVLTVQGVR